MKTFLQYVRMALMFVGFWIAYTMLLMLGIAIRVWLGTDWVWLGNPMLGIAGYLWLGNHWPAPRPQGLKVAWRIITDAWFLWLLGAAMLACWILSTRYLRKLEARYQSPITSPGPAPSPKGAPSGKRFTATPEATLRLP